MPGHPYSLFGLHIARQSHNNYKRFMQVFIYQDYTFNHGVLYKRLISTFGQNNVYFADVQDIINGILDTADLLVMPGGADLYNCEKLNGMGNAAIKRFVEQGGCYLGICAGAYYACDTLDWGINTRQEITGKRELAFFKGKAIGPVYEFIENNNIEKSWKNIVTVTFDNQTEHVFYEAGPLFTEGQNETVMARYTDLANNPAAIIACPVGQGLTILSSPHIEYTAHDIPQIIYQHRNPSYDWDKTLISKSLPGDGQLWHMVCNRIRLHRQA